VEHPRKDCGVPNPASVAGLKKLVEMGVIDKNEIVVCITTGHLLKDPQTVIDVCEEPTIVDANIEAIREAVFGKKNE
jgi:threonine synthase